MNKEITDEMVKSFIRKGSMSEAACIAILNEWEEFKAGSPSGRDWEITCYKKGYALFDCIDGIPVGHNYWMNDKDALIHSVRRNDKEVFTCGKDAKHPNYTIPLMITGFKIEENKMMVQFHPAVEVVLSQVQPASPTSREPLFVTSDGGKIFDNEAKLSVVFGDWSFGGDYTLPMISKLIKVDSENRKVFSSYEAAKDYVLMNKPFLSVQDVMNRLNGYFKKEATIAAFENLKAFAQQKINPL